MKLSDKHPQETMKEFIERTYVSFSGHISEIDPDEAREAIMRAFRNPFINK